MSNEHWDFFKDGDQSFGLFYPRNYTLAGFGDDQTAQAAATELRAQGFADEDVRVVGGRVMVEELESQDDAGWLDRMKASIAEFIGTEAYFIDQDIALAKRDGSFVFVYTPESEQAEQAETIIRRHHPEHARRYLSMAIERLVEPQMN